MHYPLEEFETIPQQARQKLEAVGIDSSDNLLSRGDRTHLRKRLTRQTGIAVDDLTRWVGMADLVRIKGIGPKWAQILVYSGIGSVQQFLQALDARSCYSTDRQAAKRIGERASVQFAASQLATTLKATAEEHQIAWRTPTVRELAEAAEEASELRPRVVVAESPDGNRFRRSVRARAKRETWVTLRAHGFLIGIVLVALLVMLLVMHVWATLTLDDLSNDGDILTVLIAELWRVAFRAQLLSMGTLAIMVTVALILMFLTYALISHLQNTCQVFIFFNTPTRRAFYEEAQSLGIEREKRGVWWGMRIFVVIALSLVIYASFSTISRPDEPLEAFGQRLHLPMAVAGIVLVGVVAYPVVRFYVQELRKSRVGDDDSFRLYLVYLLSKLAWLPLLIVILSQVILPGLFKAQGHVYRRYILPNLASEINERRPVVVSLAIDDQAGEQRRERLLQSFDEIVTNELPTYGAVSPEGTEVWDLIIPAALNMAFWWSFAGILLLFVVPYLVLGNWRRGVFYAALVFASFAIEEGLQASAPTWFRLNPGSPASRLIIWTVVFANALFFDWLYDRVTECKKVCPGCHTSIDDDALFCPVCGLVHD